LTVAAKRNEISALHWRRGAEIRRLSNAAGRFDRSQRLGR
jgi:hypothetical protein